MPNPATAMRHALAERIANAYVARGAEAVLLGGSTGRGEADSYSDIELGVFWSRGPTEDERASAIAAAGGDVHRLGPYTPADRAWFDEWFVGRRGETPKSGVLVEPVHMTIAAAEATIADVVERFDAAIEKQVLLAALCDGVPLAGHALLTGWRLAVQGYPDGLARAVVERHGQIDHFWRFPMYRERGNPIAAARAAADVHERVLHALLAVNRVYWYGFKLPEHVARRLTIAPEGLVARVRRTYEVAPPEQEELLAALVEETYDLAERHVPGLDVERLRAIFRYRRPLWDGERPELQSPKRAR